MTVRPYSASTLAIDADRAAHRPHRLRRPAERRGCQLGGPPVHGVYVSDIATGGNVLEQRLPVSSGYLPVNMNHFVKNIRRPHLRAAGMAWAIVCVSDSTDRQGCR